MKTLVLLIPAAALLMTGCGSLLSVSPLYSDQNVVQDPGLIGAWHAAKEDDKDILVVQPGQDGDYQVLYTSMQDSAKTMKFDIRLVQLKDYRFVDMVRDTEGWTIPGHSLAKISLIGDVLKFSFMDSGWLKNQIAPMKRSEMVVLPGGTEALQQMVLKYAAEPRAFEDAQEFHRLTQ